MCIVTTNITEEVTKTCRLAYGVLNPSLGAELEVIHSLVWTFCGSNGFTVLTTVFQFVYM